MDEGDILRSGRFEGVTTLLWDVERDGKEKNG